MESSIELKDKDYNGEFLIGNAGNIGNFEESKLKRNKKMKIIIIISILLLVAIVAVILYLCLRADTARGENELCEKGENEKCLFCQKNSEKCAACNPNFRLEDGKCFFIYSFEAIYKARQTNGNEAIKLFNVEFLNNYKINKIQVDDKYIEKPTNYYTFISD